MKYALAAVFVLVALLASGDGGSAPCVNGIEINGKVYTGIVVIRPDQDHGWFASTHDDGKTYIDIIQYPPRNK